MGGKFHMVDLTSKSPACKVSKCISARRMEQIELYPHLVFDKSELYGLFFHGFCKYIHSSVMIIFYIVPLYIRED
jgi:hypothetical protein